MIERFNGREFRKSSFSTPMNEDCIFLPATGIINAVADSKTGHVLAVPVNPKALAALHR